MKLTQIKKIYEQYNPKVLQFVGLIKGLAKSAKTVKIHFYIQINKVLSNSEASIILAFLADENNEELLSCKLWRRRLERPFERYGLKCRG